jgi:hypothetical protein
VIDGCLPFLTQTMLGNTSKILFWSCRSGGFLNLVADNNICLQVNY